MDEHHGTDLPCPRCGGPMVGGFINGGKGPLRWVDDPKQHKTIFGGEHLAKQKLVWGRHIIPAARCVSCRFGVFTYDSEV